jgi:hypothetical protein
MAFIPFAVALAGAGASAGAVTAAGVAIASTAIATIGAGVSAYGMIQQGKAQQREANYNAAVQENNAISAGYASIQEQQSASREVDAFRENRDRVFASNRTAAAASGLTLSGSVLDVMGDTSLQAEKDISMAYYRGSVNSQNSMNQASNLRSQAVMTRSAGANAKRGAYFQAAGTLISSAASAGSSYANFKK